MTYNVDICVGFTTHETVRGRKFARSGSNFLDFFFASFLAPAPTFRGIKAKEMKNQKLLCN